MNQAEIKQFKFFTDAMSIKEDLNNFQQLHKKESYFKSRKYRVFVNEGQTESGSNLTNF